MEDPGERTYSLNWGKIDELRKERGLTKSKFVEKVGIHRTTLKRKKDGHEAYWSTVEKIASALKVEPHEIIFIKGSMQDKPSDTVDLDFVLKRAGIEHLPYSQQLEIIIKTIEALSPEYRVEIIKILGANYGHGK